MKKEIKWSRRQAYREGQQSESFSTRKERPLVRRSVRRKAASVHLTRPRDPLPCCPRESAGRDRAPSGRHLLNTRSWSYRPAGDPWHVALHYLGECFYPNRCALYVYLEWGYFLLFALKKTNGVNKTAFNHIILSSVIKFNSRDVLMHPLLMEW